MHDIVTAVEGDPSKLSLSYATTQRYRVETVKTIANLVPRAFPFLSLRRREKALAPGGL